MAFPTTSVIDDFNRANSATLGAGWATAFGANNGAINGNIADNGNGPYASGYRNGGTFGADSEAFCTLAAGTDYFGVYVRLADPTGAYDGYQASWSVSNLTLNKVTDGDSEQLGDTVVLAKSVGDKLGIEAIGTTIKVYTKTGAGAWTERISESDSSFTSAGFIGFDMFESGGTIGIDDFGGGTVVGGGDPPITDASEVLRVVRSNLRLR